MVGLEKNKEMKAILEFDFDSENNDRGEFRDAVNGRKWKFAMWELDQWLRAQTKYAPDSMSEDTYKAFEECRDNLRRFMSEENLDFDE